MNIKLRQEALQIEFDFPVGQDELIKFLRIDKIALLFPLKDPNLFKNFLKEI